MAIQLPASDWLTGRIAQQQKQQQLYSWRLFVVLCAVLGIGIGDGIGRVLNLCRAAHSGRKDRGKVSEKNIR